MRISDWSSDVCSSDLNLDDGGSLYHQMPFNATFALEHRLGGWESAVELTVVADKNRVDATRNEPRTDDYALVNLRTGYAWGNYRSEEHTSELQSLMRISYADFCLKKKKQNHQHHTDDCVQL